MGKRGRTDVGSGKLTGDSGVPRALVTGGAGFIGSNLVDRLLTDGGEVVILDNFRTGRHEFLAESSEHPALRIVKGDVLDRAALDDAMEGCDVVFHLAANADVRHGLEHPTRDLEQNTIGTSTVLEAMRAVGVERIVFTSTGSVYGEPKVFPTPEDCPFPAQTSLYAASKLAGEGLIEAYAHGYGFSGAVFRLVSVLGERYTHGHVFDFYRALRRDPSVLQVLGDGRQEKSYLYIGDCIDGMLAGLAAHHRPGDLGTYNLGTDETIVVDDSVGHITSHLGVSPRLEHTGGRRGWPGDSPLIHLDCAHLRGLGWRPTVSIADAITRTLAWLDANPFVFDEAERVA
jgi:UDP-glucose 4-epimerase